MLLLERLSELRSKFDILQLLHTTFSGEENADDEGGVSREAITIALERGVGLLAIGTGDAARPLLRRVGTSMLLPNRSLRLCISDLAASHGNTAQENDDEDEDEDEDDIANMIYPVLSKLPEVAGEEQTYDYDDSVCSVPLPTDRMLLLRVSRAMNGDYWRAKTPVSGKSDAIRLGVAQSPFLVAYSRCRWFEMIGRLMAYAIINFVPVSSSILPDVVLDYFGGIEPKMETKVPFQVVLRYLDQCGFGWIRSAVNNPVRCVAAELVAGDPDLEALLPKGTTDAIAVRVLAQQMLIERRRALLDAMRRGFHFLPSFCIWLSLFSRKERRLVVSGTEQLTATALRNVIEFKFPGSSCLPLLAHLGVRVCVKVDGYQSVWIACVRSVS